MLPNLRTSPYLAPAYPPSVGGMGWKYRRTVALFGVYSLFDHRIIEHGSTDHAQMPEARGQMPEARTQADQEEGI